MRVLLARSVHGIEGPTLVGSVAAIRDAARVSAALADTETAAGLLAALGAEDGGFDA